MGFVRAVGGNTACTCGLTLDDIIPPSGPSNAVSCRIRVMTAKYLGKSVVRMRVILRWYNSSADSRSVYHITSDNVCGFFYTNYPPKMKKKMHATCSKQNLEHQHATQLFRNEMPEGFQNPDTISQRYINHAFFQVSVHKHNVQGLTNFTSNSCQISKVLARKHRQQVYTVKPCHSTYNTQS